METKLLSGTLPILMETELLSGTMAILFGDGTPFWDNAHTDKVITHFWTKVLTDDGRQNPFLGQVPY